VHVELYAIIVTNSAQIEAALEDAIAKGDNAPFVENLARRLRSSGFDAVVQFIELAQREYGQYWTQVPHPNDWLPMLYFSHLRDAEFVMVLPDDFEPLYRRTASERDSRPFGQILVCEISSRMSKTGEADSRPQSFAEEMIAISLTELSSNRVRSAVLHSIIALESSARAAVESMVNNLVPSLLSSKLICSLLREVNLYNLARLVFENSPTLRRGDHPDWGQIEDLHQLRNRIVHDGQRKLPKVEDLVGKILQVKAFVDSVEKLLHLPKDAPADVESS
jgi:hypothetical protein